jgi:hypothetical protein
MAAITEQQIPLDTALQNLGKLAGEMVAATHQAG